MSGRPWIEVLEYGEVVGLVELTPEGERAAGFVSEPWCDTWAHQEFLQGLLWSVGEPCNEDCEPSDEGCRVVHQGETVECWECGCAFRLRRAGE